MSQSYQTDEMGSGSKADILVFPRGWGIPLSVKFTALPNDQKTWALSLGCRLAQYPELAGGVEINHVGYMPLSALPKSHVSTSSPRKVFQHLSAKGYSFTPREEAPSKPHLSLQSLEFQLNDNAQTLLSRPNDLRRFPAHQSISNSI